MISGDSDLSRFTARGSEVEGRLDGELDSLAINSGIDRLIGVALVSSSGSAVVKSTGTCDAACGDSRAECTTSPEPEVLASRLESSSRGTTNLGSSLMIRPRGWGNLLGDVLVLGDVVALITRSRAATAGLLMPFATGLAISCFDCGVLELSGGSFGED